VLAEGNVVEARSLRVAGNAMDEAIMRYVRRTHRLVVGEASAERIKIEAGTALAMPNGREVEIHIKGRDVREGRMKSAVLTQADMAEALSRPVGEIAEFIERAIEDLPGHIAADVTAQDIALTGGGALLDRMDAALARRLGATFKVPETPMHCVIRGTAAVLQSLDLRQHLLVGP
jgi:rod shape-determining protein MreB